MKKCNKCNILLIVEQNWLKCNKKQGHYSCQNCCREKAGEYYKQNKERLNKNSSNTKRRLKIEVFNAYGGCFCRCCGETELSFLSIDHKFNDGADERKRNGKGSRFAYWLKRNNFPNPERYQVLCMNCQWGRKLNNGICPHQLKYAQNINFNSIST